MSSKYRLFFTGREPFDSLRPVLAPVIVTMPGVYAEP
jgi:hypothetical protein